LTETFDKKLCDRVAIVTGAGAGIGEAAALLFSAHGAKIVAVDWLGERADATVKEIHQAGGAAIAVKADVSLQADVRRIVATTLSAFGKPTILFNNAGINQEQRRPLTHIPEEDFDKTVAVNLKGPFLMMKYVVPHMIEAGGGTIVNTASLAAFDHVSTAGYSASKAGLVAMTRVAAAELGIHKIRVNALCPGAIETPLAASQREGMKARGLPGADELMLKVSALKRMGTSLEMAKVALFLASEDSSYTTGQPFIADGGWNLYAGVEKRPL